MLPRHVCISCSIFLLQGKAFSCMLVAFACIHILTLIEWMSDQQPILVKLPASPMGEFSCQSSFVSI